MTGPIPFVLMPDNYLPYFWTILRPAQIQSGKGFEAKKDYPFENQKYENSTGHRIVLTRIEIIWIKLAQLKITNACNQEIYKHLTLFCYRLFAEIVGMTGLEPAAPSSRTKCATGLRYIPKEMQK